MGRIGQAIGRRLEASLVPVSYHSRNPSSAVSYKHYPDLMEMAKAVDTLIVIVPGGASTAKMINADVLKALGPRGVLINVARGSVVDEPALVAALKSGTILAAGLDVFANEPNVPDELKAMQNVVLLPHIGSASVVTRNAMDQLVVDNLKNWFAGKAPLTPCSGNPGEGTLMSLGRSGIAAAALTALLALAPQVAAQDASTLKKDMIGQWELPPPPSAAIAQHRSQRITLVDLNDEPGFVPQQIIDRNLHLVTVKLAKRLFDPDAFILGCAILKAHDNVVATLSVKNLVMAAPLHNPRGEKTEWHHKYLYHSGYRNIQMNLALTAARMQPYWGATVIDGFEGMEGEGPLRGTRSPSRVALASTDFVAADRIGVELMGSIPPGWAISATAPTRAWAALIARQSNCGETNLAPLVRTLQTSSAH